MGQLTIPSDTASNPQHKAFLNREYHREGVASPLGNGHESVDPPQ